VHDSLAEHGPSLRANEEAARSAKALYTAKAALYRFLFLYLIGYGWAIALYFRRRKLIRSGMRVLDAGCGTGLLTKTHYGMARKRHLEGVRFFAFDLTPRMLGIFRNWVETEGAQSQIELRELDVLKLEERPAHWQDFDLVVTSAMLEYIPRESLPSALEELISMLKPGGRLVLGITRRDWMTRWLVGTWWQSNLYTRPEISEAFRLAGAEGVDFDTLPWPFRLTLGSIIIAEYRKPGVQEIQAPPTRLHVR